MKKNIHISHEEIYHRRVKRHSLPHIFAGIMVAGAWGATGVFILNALTKIEKVWPGDHSHW